MTVAADLHHPEVKLALYYWKPLGYINLKRQAVFKMETSYLYPNDMTIVTDCFRHGLISYAGETIYILELDAIDRNTVEKWTDFIIDIRCNWPDVTKHVYSIMDFSKNDVSMTRLANKRVQELVKYNPRLVTHNALVVRQSVLGKILGTTAMVLSHTMKPFDIQVFDDRESAYGWLVNTIEHSPS